MSNDKFKGVMFDNPDLKLLDNKESDNILREEKTTQYYVDMNEHAYLSLQGKEKSKAAIIRAAHNRRLKKGATPPNPRGNNQYTKEKEIRDFLYQTAETNKAYVPTVIETIVAIAKHSKSELNKLRACELMLSYTIAKPQHQKVEKVEGKTFIILPPDVILNESNIIKVNRVKDPEKNK